MKRRIALFLLVVMPCLAILHSSATPASAFGLSTHTAITQEALGSFLNTDVLDTITNANYIADLNNQVFADQHFDNCRFKEGTNLIHNRYTRVRAAFNPNGDPLLPPSDWPVLEYGNELFPTSGWAALEFGLILHALQDFYSHSNWYETFGPEARLLNDDLINWSVMQPFQPYEAHEDLIVVENELPPDWGISIGSDYRVWLTDPDGRLLRGLVSGHVVYAVILDTTEEAPLSLAGGWTSFLDALLDKIIVAKIHGVTRHGCPQSTLNHGLNHGSFATNPFDDEPTVRLAKDDPNGRGHQEARSFALRQTEHEWCRLVAMVRASYGDAGVRRLFDEWVNNREAAIAACSSPENPYPEPPFPNSNPTIAGIVTSQTGVPLPNIRVLSSIGFLGSDEVIYETTTGNDGRFRFELLNVAVDSIQGSTLTFIDPAGQFASETYSQVELDFETRLGPYPFYDEVSLGAVDIHGVMFPRRYGFSGYVTNANGEPLEGIHVFANTGGLEFKPVGIAITDENGYYDLPLHYSGTYSVRFHDPTFTHLPGNWYNRPINVADHFIIYGDATPPSTDIAQINTILRDAGEISGTVTDQYGAPVVGAQVWLRDSCTDVPAEPIVTTWTEETGEFRFSDIIEPGTYRLLVSHTPLIGPKVETYYGGVGSDCTSADTISIQSLSDGSMTQVENLTVQFALGDNPPIILILSTNNLTYEATGPDGALVNVSVDPQTAVGSSDYDEIYARDDYDGRVPVTCDSTFPRLIPVGTFTLNCSAMDQRGHQRQSAITLVVADTRPPTLTAPADIAAMSTGPEGAAVLFDLPTATDVVDINPDVFCAPASSSVFAVGVTTVACTATDFSGNSTSVSFAVTVQHAGSILAWWQAEGNELDAVGTYHGSLLNGTWFSSGPVGQAFSFDGIDDSVFTPFWTDFTTGISYDLILQTTDTDGTVFVNSTQNQHRRLGLFVEDDGQLALWGRTHYENVHSRFKLAGPTINDDTPHCVTVTWTGDGAPSGAKLYVDGVLYDAVSYPDFGPFEVIRGPEFLPFLPLSLGGHIYSQFPHEFPYLNGLIDEVRVYGRALNASEARSDCDNSAPNHPPTLDAGGPYSLNEGGTITLTATGNDPDGDPLTFEWDLDDDGVFESAGASAIFSAGALDGPQEFPVTVKVSDGAGASATDSATIEILNVAPDATITNSGPIIEGGSATITLSNPHDSSSTDAAAGFRYAFACDGASLDGATYASSAPEATGTCQFDDGPGGMLVHARIFDKDGGYNEYTSTVAANNAVPTAMLEAPVAVNEGATFALSLVNPVDPSVIDTTSSFAYAFDCGDDQGYGAFGASASASCMATNEGARLVRAIIRDKDGGQTEYSAALTISNAAPTVSTIVAPLDPVTLNASVATIATFSDPGVLDTHAALWEWGDGSTSVGSINEVGGAGSVTGSHVYAVSGVYTVRLTVNDDTGAETQSTFEYVIVYNPAGSFVTGGGWMTPAPGAFVADPALTERVKFGFNVRYASGSSVPTGQMRLEIRNTDFDFEANAYQWLVVVGAKAQFRGSGTVNGQGDYGFLVTAIEGAPGNRDTLRVKIWDRTNGNQVVFDTMMNAPDSANPTTEVGGGSVKIH